jgi:hypothetical protein
MFSSGLVLIDYSVFLFLASSLLSDLKQQTSNPIPAEKPRNKKNQNYKIIPTPGTVLK